MIVLLITAILLIKRYKVSSTFVDISPLLSATSSIQDIKKCSNLIDQELIQNGYFVTSYANISNLLHPYVFDAANDLFSLNFKAKSKYSIKSMKTAGRGYLTFGSEAGVSSYYELKEGFSYGYPSSVYSDNEVSKGSSLKQQHPLQQRNIWPEIIKPESIQHLELLFKLKSLLSNTILQSLKVAIQQEQDENIESQDSKDRKDQHQLNPYFLDDELPGGDRISLMRVFHYFTNHSGDGYIGDSNNIHLQSENKTLTGSSPHTDWGLLTVITYNGVDGLEFFDRRTNSWQVLPYVENGIVINAGDYLKLLSGGRYHSPVHRVVLPKSEKNRMSFVFFFYPRYDSIIPKRQSNRHNQKVENSANKDLVQTVNTCTAESDNCQNIDISDKTNDHLEGLDHFESFEYNTLLKDENEKEDQLFQENDVIFGDYILEKWEGVYAPQAADHN